MTPKEKAKELYDKYLPYTHYLDKYQRVEIYNTKQCALIAVDEILESHYKLLLGVKTSIYKYWQEVKKEIELL